MKASFLFRSLALTVQRSGCEGETAGKLPFRSLALTVQRSGCEGETAGKLPFAASLLKRTKNKAKGCLLVSE